MSRLDRDLTIIAFPGAPNLPLFAAEARGFFTEAGLGVRLETTPSSVYQFEKFAAGAFDIAFSAFDNIVAYREGQGAVKLSEVPDFRAVMGATQIELSLVVAPDVKSVEDLRGRSLALDAVGTGFAFVLYDMLERKGLPPSSYEVVPVGATPERWRAVKAGTHAGTITIEPFTSIARANGFPTLLRSTDMFPAYQGGVIAVRRDWAEAHDETMVAFLGAYLQGLAWTLDPVNRQAGAKLLAEKMPEIQPQVLDAVMTSLLTPRSGLTPDGAILREGARAVLELRSRYGAGKKQLSDIDTYLDLRWMGPSLPESGTSRP
jgi:ABC-type nitrate/sulfonate/bicarbonate transport system substrate-binding protein